jgi:hypothetical protein
MAGRLTSNGRISSNRFGWITITHQGRPVNQGLQPFIGIFVDPSRKNAGNSTPADWL